MSPKETAIKVGDWVRITALWPGIWQVYRIIADFKEHRWSLKEPSVMSPRTLFYCHRIVNDSWKRAFSFQCCELSYLKALTPSDLQQVENCLLPDTKLMKSFEKYQATKNTLDLVANLAFGGLNGKGLEEFSGLCNAILADRINGGVTLDDVLALLSSVGLDAHANKHPKQATLQLASINHELRGDEFLFRQYRVLSF